MSRSEVESLQLELLAGRFAGSDEELARQLQAQELNALSPSTRTRRRARKAPDFFQPPLAGGYGGYHSLAFAAVQQQAEQEKDGTEEGADAEAEAAPQQQPQPRKRHRQAVSDSGADDKPSTSQQPQQRSEAVDEKRPKKVDLRKQATAAAAAAAALAAHQAEKEEKDPRNSKRQRPPAPDPLPLPPTRRQRSGDSGKGRPGFGKDQIAGSDEEVREAGSPEHGAEQLAEVAKQHEGTHEAGGEEQPAAAADGTAADTEAKQEKAEVPIVQEEQPRQPLPRTRPGRKPRREPPAHVLATAAAAAEAGALAETADALLQHKQHDGAAAVKSEAGAEKASGEHAATAAPKEPLASESEAGEIRGRSRRARYVAAAAAEQEQQQPKAGSSGDGPEGKPASAAHSSGRGGNGRQQQQRDPKKIPKLPMVLHGDRWYRARLLEDNGSQVLVEFPGLVGKDSVVLLERSSERIWRGSYKGKDWRYLGDGAWAPKVKASARRNNHNHRNGHAGRGKGAHVHPRKRAGAGGHSVDLGAHSGEEEDHGGADSEEEEEDTDSHGRRFDMEGQEESSEGANLHTHPHQQRSGSGAHGMDSHGGADAMPMRGWKGGWKQQQAAARSRQEAAAAAAGAGNAAQQQQSSSVGGQNWETRGEAAEGGPPVVTRVAPSPRRRKASHKPHRAPTDGDYAPMPALRHQSSGSVPQPLSQPSQSPQEQHQRRGHDQVRPQGEEGRVQHLDDEAMDKDMVNAAREALCADDAPGARSEPQAQAHMGDGDDVMGAADDDEEASMHAAAEALAAASNGGVHSGRNRGAGGSGSGGGNSGSSPHASGVSDGGMLGHNAQHPGFDALLRQLNPMTAVVEQRSSGSSPAEELGDVGQGRAVRGATKRRGMRGHLAAAEHAGPDLPRPGRGRGKAHRMAGPPSTAHAALALRVGRVVKPQQYTHAAAAATAVATAAVAAAAAGASDGRVLQNGNSLHAFNGLLQALGALETGTAAPQQQAQHAARQHAAQQQYQPGAPSAAVQQQMELQWLAQQQLSKILSLRPELFSTCGSEHRRAAVPPLPLFQ